MSKLAVPSSKKGPLLAVLIGILAVCAVWIGYQLLASGPGVPTAGTLPETPEFKEMTELTEKLKSDTRFSTLEVFKNSDGQWVCTGALHKGGDQPALKSKLAELKPDAEWVLDVSVMAP